MASSVNEELPSPKPRTSPMHYRNTDLVSRLLAATPPYLYNMPLVPHSFFFSEMLRSLVQAKGESARPNCLVVPHQQRRNRKRPWNNSAVDLFHKEQSKVDKKEGLLPPMAFKETERPLELTTTTDKIPANHNNNNNNNTKPNYYDTETKVVGLPFPPPPPSFTQDKHSSFTFPQVSGALPNSNSNMEMVLPPPPPVWYPPLYPTSSPYGIDPLHFFIDLRVSGHIYDKKHVKEPETDVLRASSMSTTTTTTTTTGFDEIIPAASPLLPSAVEQGHHVIFKQPRHSSAFSVPSVLLSKNAPMNLTSYLQQSEPNNTAESKVKFDVKSMGFEKSSNKLNTNYVMNNIVSIYKELQTNYCTMADEQDEEECQQQQQQQQPSPPIDNAAGDDDEVVHQVKDISVVSENHVDDSVEETEEEREKRRVRDLRALIGLELVVDYMNHSKPPGQSQHNEDSAGEVVDDDDDDDDDSNDGSAVDVVAVQEDVVCQLP